LHQFKVKTKGECEAIIHGIRCTLDLHPNWVVFQLNMANAFNFVSRGVIFQELHVKGGNIIQLIPFVHAFYAFEFPLFYSHCNHEGNVTIIPFAMGTREGDPLKNALFTFAHFEALHSIVSRSPSCLFLFVANDIHIISPLLNYIIYI